MNDAALRASHPGWNGAATRFVVLNVAGGVAVLASYAWGLAHLGSEASRAWGGVPDGLRPLYQASMFSAAAGYFPMSLYLLSELRRGAGETARAVNLLYAAILGCSAAWLPLTCAMIEAPSAALWWTIRIDLAIVGIASLSVLALLVRRKPEGGRAWWACAVAGAVAFCFQTAVLDAIVWPAYFHGSR